MAAATAAQSGCEESKTDAALGRKGRRKLDAEEGAKPRQGKATAAAWQRGAPSANKRDSSRAGGVAAADARRGCEAKAKSDTTKHGPRARVQTDQVGGRRRRVHWHEGPARGVAAAHNQNQTNC